MVVERCRFTGGDTDKTNIGGTPKDLTIRDSFLAGKFIIGSLIGATERILLENTHLGKTEVGLGGGEALSVQSPAVSFVDGTIKIAVGVFTGVVTWNGPSVASSNPVLWAIPGTKACVFAPTLSIAPGLPLGGFSGGPDCARPINLLATFTVLDVTTDGSGNYSVITDLEALPSTAITVTGTVAGTTLTVTAISPADACLPTGMVIAGGTLPAGTTIVFDASNVGIPNTSGSLGTYKLSNSATIGTPTNFTASVPMDFLAHPCPRFTVRDCTAGTLAGDMAEASPDLPIYSSFRRKFTGLPLVTFNPQAYVNLIGNLVSWTIDVQRAYTGSAGSFTCTICLFGWVKSGTNYYPTFLNQVINLKVAGVRTITATTATSPGGSGDTIAAVPFWLTGGHFVTTGPAVGGGDTLAKMPKILMYAQSDQGIDFASMEVNTATSGMQLLVDSVMNVQLP
jgi:hypothetical protein